MNTVSSGLAPNLEVDRNAAFSSGALHESQLMRDVSPKQRDGLNPTSPALSRPRLSEGRI
jgi:hypothetical protein